MKSSNADARRGSRCATRTGSSGTRSLPHVRRPVLARGHRLRDFHDDARAPKAKPRELCLQAAVGVLSGESCPALVPLSLSATVDVDGNGRLMLVGHAE